MQIEERWQLISPRGQAGVGQPMPRLPIRRRRIRRPRPEPGGERDIVEHAEVHKGARNLVRARDTQPVDFMGGQRLYGLPAQQHLSAVGAIMTADDVDKCGLAGAVWTDETEDLASLDVQIDAAQSLGRLLGKDVSYLVTLDEPQRRREVRRLAGLPLREVRPEDVLSRPSGADTSLAVAPTSAPATSMTPLMSLEALCGALTSEIRCAIRGRTLADLVRVPGGRESELEQACELLIARGQVVRRGLKYFTA